MPEFSSVLNVVVFMACPFSCVVKLGVTHHNQWKVKKKVCVTFSEAPGEVSKKALKKQAKEAEKAAKKAQYKKQDNKENVS